MIWGRKKPVPAKPDIEFVSIPAYMAALAARQKALAEAKPGEYIMLPPEPKLPPGTLFAYEHDTVSSSEEDMQRFVDKEPWGNLKLAKFFFARREQPADRTLRWMSAGVILAESYEHAQQRRAEALRQRGSSAKIDEFAFRCLDKPRDAEPDYGILATMMIDP